MLRTDSAFIYGAGIQYSESQDDGRLRPATHLQFSALESDAGTSARAAAVAAASGSKLASDVVPGVQAFNEHNGNEARQSYHGLPRGTVQPIMSPNRFVMNPMQINTRNPDGSGTRGGPLPRESQVRFTSRTCGVSAARMRRIGSSRRISLIICLSSMSHVL